MLTQHKDGKIAIPFALLGKLHMAKHTTKDKVLKMHMMWIKEGEGYVRAQQSAAFTTVLWTAQKCRSHMRLQR